VNKAVDTVLDIHSRVRFRVAGLTSCHNFKFYVFVRLLLLQESAGDILVFLSGKEEVDTAIELITENALQFSFLYYLHIYLFNGRKLFNGLYRLKQSAELYAVPLYSGLTVEEQLRVFAVQPRGVRKVVVATNIAEGKKMII
jgi:ATP-dependent RNA helicase DDX35